MDPAALRIIDANLNRAREGLRVLEEHARLVLDDEALTTRIKHLRHVVGQLGASFGSFGSFGIAELLAARDIQRDVGTRIATESEQARRDTHHVAAAAAKRITESLRSIEEYGKLIDANAAARAEQLRYDAYALEQAVLLGGPRRRSLRNARLHVLVTESLCSGPWPTVCEQAIAGGADVIQLREKNLPDRELLARARRLRTLTREHHVLFMVNDRPDIARLAEADGVHVGQDDLPVSEARHIAGNCALVGKSTHSAAQARAALAERPDYIAVGPMFASATKPSTPVRGPRLLAEVAGFADAAVVAIGGITLQNIDGLTAGRRIQLAVCNAAIGADDVAAAVRALKDRLTSHSDEAAPA